MKRILILIVLMLAAVPVLRAEEQKKADTPFASGSAKGGMTYSASQGWVKSDAANAGFNTGTDSMTYSNKKKAEEEAKKKNEEIEKKVQAEIEAWRESKKKQADAMAAPPPAEKKEEPAADEEEKPKKKKKSGKTRVLVS